ncbi:ATP-binding protein [Streptomyces sp. GMY02]|uniref:ATP-binding protein n=1 Tax=Streptomyces sp. GMY02 TaxID=1333528 RepID=UPI001C2BE189|nr:ATP-binding protein [Streptomyces sp. GMY02]QXE34638.1 ATP-binding protein [Streptomyces sp. GMY02]
MTLRARVHAYEDLTRTGPGSDGRAGWEFVIERASRPGRTGMAEGDERWPGQVRRGGVARVRGWGLGELADDVGLLLSELVTNALRYGRGDQVGVTLRFTGLGMLRVEVDDGSPVPARIRTARPGDEGGRGLLVVDAVVSGRGGDWGVSADGTKTWCLLPVGTPRAAATTRTTGTLAAHTAVPARAARTAPAAYPAPAARTVAEERR